MKKLLVSVLLVAMIASFAGCKKDMGRNNSSSMPSSSMPSSSAASSTPASSGAASSDISSAIDVEDMDNNYDDIATGYFDKIHESYGEGYLANATMDMEYINSTYGLTSDMYEYAKGEMSMISTHPDAVIIVKAKPGMADSIEKALNDAKDKIQNDTLQYPMNLPKTAASQVVRNGDYISFILLGSPLADNNADEAAIKTHFENEAQKAADAFKSLFDMDDKSKDESSSSESSSESSSSK